MHKLTVFLCDGRVGVLDVRDTVVDALSFSIWLNLAPPGPR